MDETVFRLMQPFIIAVCDGLLLSRANDNIFSTLAVMADYLEENDQPRYAEIVRDLLTPTDFNYTTNLSLNKVRSISVNIQNGIKGVGVRFVYVKDRRKVGIITAMEWNTTTIQG